MLLTPPHFARFSKRKPCDTREHSEALFAISCVSRAEVDGMVRKAVAAGGAHALDPQDHGFMYQSSFYDLDGHHWEVIWMDPKAVA
jgi:predicted lactoylglutathione lyase